jgi:D-alanine-D-alanine ligase
MANARLKVAVIMGGISPEREVSLRSGEAVLRNLSRERYEVISVEIRADGSWRRRDESAVSDHSSDGTPDLLRREKVDLAFIALHGVGGEDGSIQGLLESFGIPYTGSGVLASALGMDKAVCKIILRDAGIETPAWFSIRSADPLGKRTLIEGGRKLGLPVIVKPRNSGSSIGVFRSENLLELEEHVSDVLSRFGSVLVEEFVEGREFTCGVLGNCGTGVFLPLPVTEICCTTPIFDYNSKYSEDGAREITPAGISAKEREKIQQTAVWAHQALGCDGLSRVDMIWGSKGLYVLEVNTIPGMTERSLCPQAAEAAGMGFSGLLSRMVELAMAKAGRPTISAA